MNIKNLYIFKNKSIKTRLCALVLAGTMITTMTGCSNSKTNHSSSTKEQSLVSFDITDEPITYLEKETSKVHSIETLSNGEKRGILLSNEPHLYESLFEQTETKVYLSDEDGNKLSNNYDEIYLLSKYSYLTTGGILLGKWVKVETDKQYDLFVGTTLRKDSNNNTLGHTVTLLDKNGVVLYSFNGFFKALIGTKAVVQNYFEGEDRELGEPNTYIYDYITGKKSEKHNYVEIVRYIDEQNEERIHLIGLDLLPIAGSYLSNPLYSFYDENLEIITKCTEEEIREWYISNGDDYSFYNTRGNYIEYFKMIYKNKQNIKKISRPKLIKKRQYKN